MSGVHTDIAMDEAYHPDPPATEEERRLAQTYKDGGLSLVELYTRLGKRAIPVVAELGITSAAASRAAPASAPVDLALVPTHVLEAEVERRRQEDAADLAEAEAQRIAKGDW